jgi:hypothetical protein
MLQTDLPGVAVRPGIEALMRAGISYVLPANSIIRGARR